MDTTAELYLEHDAKPLSPHPSSTHKSGTSNYYISCSDESFVNQIEDSNQKAQFKSGDRFRSVSEETIGVIKVSKDLTPIIAIRCKTLRAIPEREFEHQMPNPDDQAHKDQDTEVDTSYKDLDTKDEQAHKDTEGDEQDHKDEGGNDQDIKDIDEQAHKDVPKDEQSHAELVKKWSWNLPPVTLEVRLPYASVVRPSKENFYKVSKETLVESEGEGDGITMAGSEHPENVTGPDEDRSEPTKSITGKEKSSDFVPKTISAVARTGDTVTETTYALDTDGTETLKVSVDGWPRLTVTRKVGAQRYEGCWAKDPPTPPVGRSKTTCLLQANGSLFRMERFCDGPREVIALFKDNYLVCKVGKWLA